MVLKKPRLMYETVVVRKPFFRRFIWWLLGAVAALGAGIALSVAGERHVADPGLLAVGQMVALILAALAAFRSVLNFIHWLRRRDEQVRVFDRGFFWRRGKDEYKYSWTQVSTFREGARAVSIAGRPILQTGGHILKMRDGKVFIFTGIQGDTRMFARVVRPPLADIMGTNMARALRDGKSVRLHPALLMRQEGVNIGKKNIPWQDLDVAVKNSKLVIRKKDAKGKFQTARTYDTHSIDNLGGFLEVAHMTIRNHQPERFNIKIQGPQRHAQ